MDGYYLNGVIMPLQIAQCELVYIFKHYSLPPASLSMFSPSSLNQTVPTPVFEIQFLSGSGPSYFEWLCNIPSGVSFVIEALGAQYNGTVQPGSSLGCLGPVSVNYSLASYNTAAFESFTQGPFPTAAFAALPTPFNRATTTTFPAESYSTVDLNGQTLTSQTDPTETPSATFDSVTSDSGPRIGAMAGLIIGCLVFLVAVFVCGYGLWRRNKRFSAPTVGFPTIQVQPPPHHVPVITTQIPVQSPPQIPVQSPPQIPIQSPPQIPVQSPPQIPVQSPPQIPVQSPPSVPQANESDLAAVLDVLHRARLSPTERNLVTSISAQLADRSEVIPPKSPPPKYSE